MSEAAIDAARKDAELAALRAELTKYRECVKNPGSAMEWIAVMQAEQVALRARVAALQAGHDRYEWLRRQNLATVNVLWRQAMIGGNRFDDLVDELRATESAGAAPDV
ncbi:MAG: hypothetical protein E6Q97_36525 [Desulfurellales bacterium]|nr:MAG: hypothetical protein E6Q97_36525 [Desulfurellales bacterium]